MSGVLCIDDPENFMDRRGPAENTGAQGNEGRINSERETSTAIQARPKGQKKKKGDAANILHFPIPYSTQ
jgi:hypothetical protein